MSTFLSLSALRTSPSSCQLRTCSPSVAAAPSPLAALSVASSTLVKRLRLSASEKLQKQCALVSRCSASSSTGEKLGTTLVCCCVAPRETRLRGARCWPSQAPSSPTPSLKLSSTSSKKRRVGATRPFSAITGPSSTSGPLTSRAVLNYLPAQKWSCLVTTSHSQWS